MVLPLTCVCVCLPQLWLLSPTSWWLAWHWGPRIGKRVGRVVVGYGGAKGQSGEVFLKTAPPCSQLAQDRAPGVLLRVTLVSSLFPTHHTLCWITKCPSPRLPPPDPASSLPSPSQLPPHPPTHTHPCTTNPAETKVLSERRVWPCHTCLEAVHSSPVPKPSPTSLAWHCTSLLCCMLWSSFHPPEGLVLLPSQSLCTCSSHGSAECSSLHHYLPSTYSLRMSQLVSLPWGSLPSSPTPRLEQAPISYS